MLDQTKSIENSLRIKFFWKMSTLLKDHWTDFIHFLSKLYIGVLQPKY